MGGKGLYILNQAYGGWSAGEPGRGKSTAFCNHNSDSGTLRWEHLYDRNIITPTINDFFRPGNAFTPYSRPNTDKYHRYAVTSYADSMVCTQGEPQEDRPRDGSIVLPAGGAPFVSSQLRDVNDGLTRVGIVNIRQETNGDMLFDVYFNFWEGEFNDARNFGYLKRYDDGTECESGSVCWRNVWESMTLAGVAHDTVVVGPNGFLVNTGRKITVKTGTTMKVLGPITVEGTLAVESGVVWETIAADITVAEGGRLEIGSGATLKFASGKKLKVKGNLIANNATFTRSGTSGTWGGIEADATGAKLELTGCSIRYGTYGIRGTTNAKTDTLILRQCTFDANGTGLSFVGNTSAGNRSMISDSGSTYINNTGDAVYVEAATPTSSIKSATIEYNEGWGIYLFNNAMSVGGYGTGSNIRRNKGGIRLNIHTGTIWRNTVHHNVTSVATTYPGILCTSGSTIKKNNVHTNGVRNLSFDGDDTAQLDTNWVYTDSTIASGDAEIFANNYFDLVLRQNNIHTSDYNDYGEPTGTLPWAIRNDGNELEINAPYNWWGTASPTFSAIIVDVTNANTSYALSLPSNADWSLKPTRQSVDEVADSEVAWENARTLEIVGDDARALAGYQGFVDDFPAADGVPSAVRRIFALMTRSGASKSEMEDYFNGLAQERVSAKVLLAAQEMRRQTMVWFGEYDDAVAAYRAVAESDGPAARRQIAWFRIAYIAKTLGDNTLLRDAISGVLAGGQESNLAQIVLAEFGEQVTKPTNETATADLPALTAVPNPFNPTTSITYRVTAQGNVSVQVYNALGQRVRELVNTTAQPGVYTVVWDGKDSAARPVGSGVYLVRLITPAAVVTERVTLLR